MIPQDSRPPQFLDSQLKSGHSPLNQYDESFTQPSYHQYQRDSQNINHFPASQSFGNTSFQFRDSGKSAMDKESSDIFQSGTFRKNDSFDSNSRSQFEQKNDDVSSSKNQLIKSIPSYIQLGTRSITAKQYIKAFLEGKRITSYKEALSGSFRFAELLKYIEIINKQGLSKNQKQQYLPYNMQRPQNTDILINEANSLFDSKFALTELQIRNRKTESEEIIRKYMHNTSLKLTYQKSAGLGRVAEREAYVVEGKIKQLLPDSNRSIDSITREYKEKQIMQIRTKIEQKGGIVSSNLFKWTSKPSKKFRIIFTDINQKNYAIYTDTYEEAVKLRDFAICFTLESKNTPISPIGIMKFLAAFHPKARIAAMLRENIKKYAEHLKQEQILQEQQQQQQLKLQQEKQQVPPQSDKIQQDSIKQNNSIKIKESVQENTLQLPTQNQIFDQLFPKGSLSPIASLPSLTDFPQKEADKIQSAEFDGEEGNVNKFIGSNKEILNSQSSKKSISLRRDPSHSSIQISASQIQSAQNNQIKGYDKLFFSKFSRHLQVKLKPFQKREYQVSSVQTMREEADHPVDVYITFHQLQLEFKPQQSEAEMILKPVLRLEISEPLERGGGKVEMLLKSRICGRNDIIKEFEFFGDQKMANVLGTKLERLKQCQVKIEVIDELTSGVIARNILMMEQILAENGNFINMLLTIEPQQSLSEKLMVSVHLQTYVCNSQSLSMIQENDSMERQVERMIPSNIEQYLQSVLVSQNYITDNFYQCKIVLDKFSPNQFKIILHLVEQKGISTAPLQLAFRKQDNKLEAYQSVRISFFKYYMEEQAEHQCQLTKNLPEWNQFFDDIVCKSDGMKIGDELDTSDAYILSDAVKEMKEDETTGADDYLANMESVKPSRDQYNSQQLRRIVSSVFYKKDQWEEQPEKKEFFQQMKKLSLKGIPNGLRYTLWLEIGKSVKHSHITEQQLLSVQPSAYLDRRSRVYLSLVKMAYLYHLKIGEVIREIIEDLEEYRENEIVALDDQELEQVVDVIYAFAQYLEINKGKIIYSKQIILFLIRAMEFYKAKSHNSDAVHSQENTFWLLVSFVNTFANRYYSIKSLTKLSELNPSLVSGQDKNQFPFGSKVSAQNDFMSNTTFLNSNNNQNIQNPINSLSYKPHPFILMEEEMIGRIKEDMIEFEYWLAIKCQKIYIYFREISFSASLFFAENALSCFSSLFNQELLFRLWDFLFVETNQKRERKYSYCCMAIALYFLISRSDSIVSTCKSVQDIQLFLSLSGKLEMRCNLFLSQVNQIYNQIMQNAQQQEAQLQESRREKTKSKKIFDQIVNVSKELFTTNNSLQKFSQQVNEGYSQLNAHHYIMQNEFLSQYFYDYGDLSTVSATLDYIDQFSLQIINQSKIQQQNAQAPSLTSSQQQLQAQKLATIQPQKFLPIPTSSSSALQQSNQFQKSQIQKSNYQQPELNVKQQQQQLSQPVKQTLLFGNLYKSQVPITQIYLRVHLVEMTEDYSEVLINLTFQGIIKSYKSKKVSQAVVFDIFDCTSKYPLKPNDVKSKLKIDIFKDVNNVFLPLKKAVIDLSYYPLNTLIKDYIVLHNIKVDKREDKSTLSTFSSGIDLSLLLVTEYSSQPQEGRDSLNGQPNQLFNNNMQGQATIQFQNSNNGSFNNSLSSSNRFNQNLPNMIATLQGNQTNRLAGSNVQSSSSSLANNQNQNVSSSNSHKGSGEEQLKEKILVIPAIFQIRKTGSEVSKWIQFNKQQKSFELDQITHYKFESNEKQLKWKSAMTIEQFKLFQEQCPIPFWSKLPSEKIISLFAFNDHILIIDILLSLLLKSKGSYLNKIPLLLRVLKLSSSKNQPNGYNPKALLNIISEMYFKNQLYISFDVIFQFYKVPELSIISKAKYFFDCYSVIKGQQISKNGMVYTQKTFEPTGLEKNSQLGKLSLSLDITLFIISYCNQQMQFKCSFDFMIDSEEFINAFKTYFKETHNIDNPSGKLLIYYWTKGQLKQLRAQYGYSTLGVANFSLLKSNKEKLGIEEAVIQNSEAMLENKSKSNQQPTKDMQILKLMEYNDYQINFLLYQNILPENKVQQTFKQLPLMGYFNSINKAINSGKKPNILNQDEDISNKIASSVFVKFNLNGITQGHFCLEQEQSIELLPQQKRKQIFEILREWEIVKNVPLQLPQGVGIQSNKTLFIKSESVPLYLNVQDIYKYIYSRVMAACVEKIEMYIQGKIDDQWIKFFLSVKELDFERNIRSIGLYDFNSKNIINLDQKYTIHTNFERMNSSFSFQALQQILFIFDFSTEDVRDPLVYNFDLPQKYSLFHFKDEGKSWLPCKIIGCNLDIQSSPRFYVEFDQYPGTIYLKPENEICIDQDIQLQRMDADSLQYDEQIEEENDDNGGGAAAALKYNNQEENKSINPSFAFLNGSALSKTAPLTSPFVNKNNNQTLSNTISFNQPRYYNNINVSRSPLLQQDTSSYQASKEF